MKVGFDVDGVLAAFPSAYQREIVALTGRNTFEPDDAADPFSWNWPQEHRGYTEDEIKAVWKHIAASPSFWYGLEPLDHCRMLAMLLPELEHNHDVYYITSRPGATAKRQTEAWLYRYLPYEETGLRPTVLISHDKGSAAKALALDCYIDDNRENAVSVSVNSKARSYLLDRRYNQGSLPRTCVRVPSVGAFFDRELVNL